MRPPRNIEVQRRALRGGCSTLIHARWTPNVPRLTPNAQPKYTTSVSAEQHRDLLAAKARLMTFDCSFDLMDHAAGEKQYLQGHIPGAVYAHPEHALAEPPQPDASGNLHPHADSASGGRHPL